MNRREQRIDASFAIRRSDLWVRLLAVMSLWASLLGSVQGAASADEAIARSIEQQVTALREGRAGGLLGQVAARQTLADFYQQRAFQPAWEAQRASEFLAMVESAATHGLDPQDYHLLALTRFRAQPPGDAAAIAERELLLTDALVRLVHHLRHGKVDPRQLEPDWNFTPARALTVDALSALLSADRIRDELGAYSPQAPLYRRLREALARYREIDRRGGWLPVGAGALLRPGAHDARVAALQTRLLATGDLPAAEQAGTQGVYDATLVAAVKRFQSRHGLEPDGVVGPATLAALNLSAADRVQQIRVNLERVRWVATDLAADHLLVDIAGFVARLYIHGQLAWSSRVVVGRPYRSTPAFRSTLRSLVLNPTWTVPPTILREDIVPSVVRDPLYLAKNDMRVFDGAGKEVDPATVDWKRFLGRGLPYDIVQAPGPTNPLGSIKFMLPNRHAIYLHDTPARGLFRRADRASSSGCIRVETAHALAVALLDDPERWDEQRLRADIATRQTRTLLLKRRTPILLLYRTVDVDDRGTVHFRSDLYGRDAAVAAALTAPVSLPPSM